MFDQQMKWRHDPSCRHNHNVHQWLEVHGLTKYIEDSSLHQSFLHSYCLMKETKSWKQKQLSNSVVVIKCYTNTCHEYKCMTMTCKVILLYIKRTILQAFPYLAIFHTNTRLSSPDDTKWEPSSMNFKHETRWKCRDSKARRLPLATFTERDKS